MAHKKGTVMTHPAAAEATNTERRDAGKTTSEGPKVSSTAVDDRNGGNRPEAKRVAATERSGHPYLPGYYLG